MPLRGRIVSGRHTKMKDKKQSPPALSRLAVGVLQSAAAFLSAWLDMHAADMRARSADVDRMIGLAYLHGFAEGLKRDPFEPVAGECFAHIERIRGDWPEIAERVEKVTG